MTATASSVTSRRRQTGDRALIQQSSQAPGVLVQSLFPSVHAAGALHVGASAHAFVPLQSVSHEQLVEHPMPFAQLLVPEHSTLHAPEPHAIDP